LAWKTTPLIVVDPGKIQTAPRFWPYALPPPRMIALRRTMESASGNIGNDAGKLMAKHPNLALSTRTLSSMT